MTAGLTGAESETRVAPPRRADGVGRLVLIRHGQSPTNASGVFTGWLDVGLTQAGRCEAVLVGRSLTAANLAPDVVYTSDLDRAITTADLLLSQFPRHRLPADLPRETCGQLIERHYGALTGRRKVEVRAEVGEVLYNQWRNSLTVAPPALTPTGLLQLQAAGWPAHKLSGSPALSESLGDVIARVRPVLDQCLRPQVEGGATVLVVAHGNSLRALVSASSGLTAEEVARLRIPTRQPVVFTSTGNRIVVDDDPQA